ncbi:MAG: very short patch repair endonuclease [Cellulosimicrobium funkei]
MLMDAGQARPQHVPAHPGASSAEASLRMSAARRRDTAPELALRRELFSRGLRYRVAFPVPSQRRRTIDVAFTRAKVAVFVDGCFWHGCPEHGTSPRANSEWWKAKITANRTRDRDTDRMLAELGWTVVRIWEHEPAPAAAARVLALLARPGTAGSALDHRAARKAEG